MKVTWRMYAGLREFAEQEGLTDTQARVLLDIGLSSRGGPPRTCEGWQEIWNVIKKFTAEEGERNA